MIAIKLHEVEGYITEILDENNVVIGIQINNEKFKFNNGIGPVIKFIRKQNIYSLRHLAEKLNISHAYLAQVENGKLERLSEKILEEFISFFNLEVISKYLIQFNSKTRKSEVLKTENFNEACEAKESYSISNKELIEMEDMLIQLLYKVNMLKRKIGN